MRNSIITLTFAISTLYLCGILAGCGQTGALYLPPPGQQTNHQAAHSQTDNDLQQ